MSPHIKRRLLQLFGLSPASRYVIGAHQIRRVILQSDTRLRNDYLQKTTKPKLHIGAGWRVLDGWLNTDIELIPGVMRMDATKAFPFADSTFQYIFTEHMIEHVPYHWGASMLRECHRVMRDGGIVRIVTPNLTAILGLYELDLCSDQKQYLQWFCRTFLQDGSPPNSVSAINAMFRQWGHQFIYDENTLTESMHSAGFRSIRRCDLGESPHPELQNIENEQRYPKGLLNFESLALEGVK